jgi:alanine-synthesizing transaminase
MNGLSKSHNICGYRCGWMLLSGPRERSAEFRLNVGKLMSMRLCAGALPQLVIPAALDDLASTVKMVSPGGALYERRKATLDALAECDALKVIPNSGALYVFPKIDPKYNITNDKDFARELLERKHILLVPGSGFNYPTHDHFRIVMLPSPEELSNAVKEIGNVLNEAFL